MLKGTERINSAIAGLEAEQQPVYPDPEQLDQAVVELSLQEPLVKPREIIQLREELVPVQTGNAFLLHAGSCEESIDFTPSVQTTLEPLLAANAIITFNTGLQVVKLYRGGGQSAKPRSSPVEEQNGQELPSFRGSLINRPEFEAAARQPDASRLLKGYQFARQVLAELQDLANGGFASMERAHEWWNVQFAAARNQPEYQHYHKVVQEISQAIAFMKAATISEQTLATLKVAKMYASHEGLLLPYELGLTREDENGQLYATSAHMVWIGERTRQLDGAHVAFCAGIENSTGIKLGPSATAEDVVGLCKRLNPGRIPGRLILMPRMGAAHIRKLLPPLMESVQEHGHEVIWSSDPMHGNTVTTESGQKTRHFDAIVDELIGFFEVCQRTGNHPGGVHLEVTGDEVTECLGGSEPGGVTDLGGNYTTTCDPRLNPTQTVELAFIIAQELSRVRND